MNFCSQCGASVNLAIPNGDDRLRHICLQCDTIHYQNPKIVAGTLPVHGDRILLCRRAIEPRYGYWTLPAGYMEMGETTIEAALRETREEAGAAVQGETLYTLFNLRGIDQVYMFFRAELATPEFDAGEESLEVALFSEQDIPWQELAFSAVKRTLELFFEDRKTGNFPVRIEDL